MSKKFSENPSKTLNSEGHMGHEDGVFITYKFGPFCLDANRHVLTKQGMIVDLTPRPMSVLSALVERPGQLVRKEELEKKVWGMRIGGNSLSQQISVLKKALGQASGKNEYIETVPREGYRFVARVDIYRTPNGMTARHLEPNFTRLVPPGDSGYRTVVLREDEDYVVDYSGEVYRVGQPVMEVGLVNEEGTPVPPFRIGTIVRARDGSNELMFENLDGELQGVYKIDRAGHIFLDYFWGDDDEYC
jgi:DNA-binding winged helix-turn-helix (wHTH) protein